MQNLTLPHNPLQNINPNQKDIFKVLETGQHSFQTVEDMIKFMQLGYFYTIETVYKTWNFDFSIIQQQSISTAKENKKNNGNEMDEQRQKSQGETIYLPDLFLIGNIHKIQSYKKKNIQEENPSMLKASFKTTYDNKIKYILLTNSNYKNHFIKSFNRMIKNKNEKYLITNLKPVCLKEQNGWQLYFILSNTSYLIHVTDQFYNLQLKPLQRIIDQDFQFSSLKLSKIYSVDELDKNCKDGFILAQVKSKFENREKENITIVGLVNIVEYKNLASKRQLTLLITQVLYRPSILNLIQNQSFYKNNRTICNEIGRCKLIISYMPSDASFVQNLIINNHVYVFSDLQTVVTDNVNIVYVLKIQKNNSKNMCIFRVSPEPLEGINFGNEFLARKHNYFNLKEIQNLFGINLQTVKISSFLEKTINRNIVKLEVGLLQVDVIFASIKCSHCGLEVKKNPALDSYMQQQIKDPQILKQIQCGKLHREHYSLKLWGIVRVADDTGTCLIKMQHKQLMSFLQFYEYYDEMEKIVKENGRCMTIMNSNQSKDKGKHEDDPFFRMRNRIKRKYVEKVVIGYAKTELQKTFRQGLTQKDHLSFQESFQNSKKFLQHKKIFPNGTIQKRAEQIQLIPFIKALQICQID